MPTYQYRCRDCGDELEVVQSFTDKPKTTCPACKGSLRKVFAAPGITFKGSGFYKTDSRGGSTPRSSPSSESKAETTGDSATGSGDSTKKDSSTKPEKSTKAPASTT